MEQEYEILTYATANDSEVGKVSGPFKTREVAERALNSLFQAGRACNGVVRYASKALDKADPKAG